MDTLQLSQNLKEKLNNYITYCFIILSETVSILIHFCLINYIKIIYKENRRYIKYILKR